MSIKKECPAAAYFSKDLLYFVVSNTQNTNDLWELILKYSKPIIEASGSWKDGLVNLEQQAGSFARMLVQLNNYDRMVHQEGHAEYFNQGFGGLPQIGDTTHRVLVDLHQSFKDIIVHAIGKKAYEQVHDAMAQVRAQYNLRVSVQDGNGRVALNQEYGKVENDMVPYDDAWIVAAAHLDKQYAAVIEYAIDRTIVHYVKEDLHTEVQESQYVQE